MNALQFYLERHEYLHRMIGKDLLSGLDDDQIRLRFRDDVNSIAWLVWHMTRVEDVALNMLVMEQPQVLDENWLGRLNLPHHDIGTGMSDDEVANFSEQVDISTLREYHDCVAQRTREIVYSLNPDSLDEMVTSSSIAHVIEEGTFRSSGMWVADLWSGHTKGWALAQMGLTHSYGHWGAALVIRGLQGIRTS